MYQDIDMFLVIHKINLIKKERKIYFLVLLMPCDQWRIQEEHFHFTAYIFLSHEAFIPQIVQTSVSFISIEYGAWQSWRLAPSAKKKEDEMKIAPASLVNPTTTKIHKQLHCHQQFVLFKTIKLPLPCAPPSLPWKTSSHFEWFQSAMGFQAPSRRLTPLYHCPRSISTSATELTMSRCRPTSRATQLSRSGR